MCSHSGKRERVITPSSEVDLSESSASDLSLSLTQSELEHDTTDGEAPEENATFSGSDDHTQCSPESSHHLGGSNHTSQLNCQPSASALTLERYCVRDFCILLSCVFVFIICFQNLKTSSLRKENVLHRHAETEG